ncbi:hypothetical protein QSH57_016429 [Fusarium oxysporum f. sp. vasinfectum]|nr:hypothetical protein QSH57_016429 [Fusarium oxysporum f. sp. vasinfectum]
MIACRIVAVIGLLAAGVQAGPCKPSSVVTTTADATSTHSVSNTGTATSGGIATTTETTLAPSSTAYSCVNNEKTPFPAGVLCDTKGIGADPNMLFLTQVTGDATIAHCRDACRGMDDCIAFAVQPNVFCDLWGGRIQGTDGSNTDFSWYSLDCFCDLPELSTTSATATAATATTDTTILTSETATTELETSSTVPTTSSAALTSSTETTTAAATTTTIATSAPRCPGGFPSGSSCGVSKQYVGTGSYIKDIDGTYTLDECLQFCIDHPTCNLFAYAASWCELWNGEYATTGSSVNFSCGLFHVLRRWKPSNNQDTGLILEITAYSPGDNECSQAASLEYELHDNFQLEEDLESSPSFPEFMDAKEARALLAAGKNWHRPMAIQGLSDYKAHCLN